MTRDQIHALQRAMLTVPGVTLRSGADGAWGPESAAAFALTVAKAGGQPIASVTDDPTPPAPVPAAAIRSTTKRKVIRLDRDFVVLR